MYAKIINWIKQIFFPKAKKTVKSYGGYVVAFFVGLLAAFGLNSARNNRARKHIEQLRAELAEYANLNKQLERIANELESELDKLGDNNDDALKENKLLRSEVARARLDIRRLEGELSKSFELAGESIDITDRLSGESEKLGEGIDRLREFINKYGTADVGIQEDSGN